MDADASAVLAEALLRRAAATVQFDAVASVIVAVWLDVDDALYPVVGHRGVAALCRRSLHLAAVERPWLKDAIEAPYAMPDPRKLKEVLAQRTPEEAAAAGAALLQTLRSLLASLVGAPLTGQLLDGLWSSLLIDPPVQDTPP